MTGLAGHYADFFRRLLPEAGEAVWLSGALTVQASLDGHTCLDLRDIAGREIAAGDHIRHDGDSIELPDTADLSRLLFKSGAAGKPGSHRPLVLDDSCLYLQRYWQYENFLAADLKKRAADWPGIDPALVEKHLARLFPPAAGDEPDWQRLAAAVCAMKGLCVISGGPGTGKTFTVAAIIALLQMLNAASPLRIALAAPTGKAAGRLSASITGAAKALDLPSEIITGLPAASTIHRLLGARVRSPYFRHNQKNKLDIDVLIVDEVSMVDLALTAKLMAAVPASAKVIMLGDKDQLASVESGRVMGDICGDIRGNNFDANFRRSTGSGKGIEDCVVLLTKSYRFDADSGIGALAAAIIKGDDAGAVRCFDEYIQLERPDTTQLDTVFVKFYKPLFDCHDPAAAFDVFDQFQILCVLRQGRSGVKYLNQQVETLMRHAGMIHGQEKWYHGRPVMISGNNYGLNLFNGDIGITMADSNGRLRVYFKQGSEIRAISCSRIPAHETAFAITVHKSQGSEFNRVLLVLPASESPVLSRELLYTAVTRAKGQFELCGDEEIFRQGIKKRVGRSTGLTRQLSITSTS